MANFREWSSEEIEERLKNEQYRLVFPLEWKRSTETHSGNKERQTPPKPQPQKKE